MAVTKEKGTAKRHPTKAKPTTAKSNSSKERSNANSPKDVVSQIRFFLYQRHELGVENVPEDQVVFATGYKRHDSKGFRNPLKELIKDLRHVERIEKKNLKLTPEGKEFVRASGPVEAPVTSNEEMKQRLKDKVAGVAKAPAKAIDAIFNTLRDGGVHTDEELLGASGYKAKDSKGYAEVMRWSTRLNIVKKVDSASYTFTDIAFPCGRGTS